MINLVKNNRQQYQKTIINNLEEYSYRHKRYNIHFAIAIGLCDDSIDISGFINAIRETDKFIILENNLCCIIIDCVSAESAIKTTSNMQTAFQHKHFGKKLFTSVVSSEDYEDNNKMMKALFDVLEYSISNNMDNIVVDQHQMISLKH